MPLDEEEYLACWRERFLHFARKAQAHEDAGEIAQTRRARQSASTYLNYIKNRAEIFPRIMKDPTDPETPE